MESPDIISWPWNGEEFIFDEMDKVGNTNLFRGRYDMDPLVTNIMIRKGVEIKRPAYDMLKNFQHDTLIPHLNFYTEARNMGRFVIPVVQISIGNWIKGCGKKDLFDGHGKISLLFRTIIVDLCDLIEKLYDKSILIKSLKLSNLYLAAEITPRILVLLTDVEEITKDVGRNLKWKALREVTDLIYKECGLELNDDHEARRFLGFTLTEVFTLSSLARYPHNWDAKTKKEYMIALIGGKQSGKDGIRSLASQSLVKWPLVDGKVPDVLHEIIKHDDKLQIPVNYNTKITYDYIRLIRNVYKHFDELPPDIKEIFGTQSGFLKKIEEWSPDIWKDLYDTIGWP